MRSEEGEANADTKYFFWYGEQHKEQCERQLARKRRRATPSTLATPVHTRRGVYARNGKRKKASVVVVIRDSLVMRKEEIKIPHHPSLSAKSLTAPAGRSHAAEMFIYLLITATREANDIWSKP